ncbi:MAG: Maf family protein [Gammaproteobacteria bacterium]
MTKMKIILASSSPARKMLMETLHIPFTCSHPDVDETQKENESAAQLVERLARAKAEKIAQSKKHSLIIGCDQVAAYQGIIYGKPLTHERAIEMLNIFSGNEITFLTGMCVINSDTQEAQYIVEPYYVKFKKLSEEDIENYLQKDKPYRCAASIKVESLGIALIEKMRGDDPNAIIGLPLMQLIRMLNNEGVNVLENH